MPTDEPEELKETQPGDSIVPVEASLPLWPGQVLGDKYEVERVLGVGGMGIVVSAMHLELGERVAIKAMLPEVAASRDHATRFAREAQAAARIKNEFVARVTDVAKLPDGTPFMVMEHLEGETLAAHLERDGALPVEVAVDLLLEACVALAEAHRLGIVHRDVKPANLFLARQPEGGEIVKVLDFGISKSEENVSITRTSGAIGTPAYMSPEQLRAAGSVRPAADIWSLGVVLFEMLTRALPYEAASFADICALVLVSPPRTPRSVDPSLPEELERTILRCLERDPDARYGSVVELARDLVPFASERGLSLVERIELIGAPRASLVSLDEMPASGRRSFASLPRITPRSLSERTMNAPRASPIPIADRRDSTPPNSVGAVVHDPGREDLSRTPPGEWNGEPAPEEVAAHPARRRRWALVGLAASLPLLGAVGLATFARSGPSGADASSAASGATAPAPPAVTLSALWDPAAIPPAPATAPAPLPSASAPASAAAPGAPAPGAPARGVQAPGAGHRAGPLPKAPQAGTAPPDGAAAPAARPAAPAPRTGLDDFGGRK